MSKTMQIGPLYRIGENHHRKKKLKSPKDSFLLEKPLGEKSPRELHKTSFGLLQRRKSCNRRYPFREHHQTTNMASLNTSSLNTNYIPAASLGNQIVMRAQQEQPHGTTDYTRKATITGVIGINFKGLQEETVACTFRKEVDLMHGCL
jgi:hypothetical protein